MPFEFIRSFTSFAGVCALAFVCIGAPSIDGPFEDGVAFRLQYLLDRAFYSCNAIDGEWGRKSEVALATYCAANGLAGLYERNPPGAFPRNERLRFFLDRLFPGVMVPLRDHVVSEGDVRLLSFIPNSPEAKSRLVRMGYQSLLEMYVEKAHMTESAFKRLNPRAAWPNPRVGTVVRIPSFAREEGVPHAASLRVSLSRYEVTVFDGEGRFIALFPC